jgi:peptide/nickel transport system substrate-binding protein
MRFLRYFLPAVLLFPGCTPAGPEIRTVRIAYSHEMVTMDPHAHADRVTATVLAAVYEGLVSFEAGLPVRAGLADRWTTPDDTTWRLHIREGVTFHDQRMLTPGDVVASIERALTIRAVGHQLDDIQSIREVEDRTVEIKTDLPAPLLLTRLEAVAIVPRDFDPKLPIGTGPYAWRVGSVQGPVLLERWDDYWGEHPDFEEVSIQFISSTEELAVLIHQKRLDVISSVTNSYIRDHKPLESWRFAAFPVAATTYLGLNVAETPLDDRRVRRAIDLAIDRPALVSGAFPEGLARPARSLVSPAVFGFSPEHRRSGVDLELAKRLLREAGIREGTPLRLEYPGLYHDVAPLVQKALDQIGLVAVPNELPFETFYRRLEEAANQMFMFRWNFRVADASPFLDTIVHSRDPLRGLGTLNGAALSDPVLDEAIAQAAHESRSDIRLQRLQDVLQLVSDQNVYLPLYHPSVTTLIREPFILDNRQVRPQDIRLRK